MGFHTFTAGEVLTAANVNAYLMNQSVIVCTSGTRPTSPVTGMTIFETDTTNFNVWNGAAWTPLSTLAAWTTYSPGWSAGSTPTLGTNAGRYVQVGKSVTATGNVQASGTATSGTMVSTLPVAPRTGTSTSQPLGVFSWFINATGISRMGNVYWVSGTQIVFQVDNTSARLVSAIAASDALLFTVDYESA